MENRNHSINNLVLLTFLALDVPGAFDFLKLVLFVLKKNKKSEKICYARNCLGIFAFFKVFTSICVCIFLSFLQ
jgi:hypothetical protein